jgi:hypothetical protein
MRINASWIPATLTAIISICGALVYFNSSTSVGVITSLLVFLAVFGLLGLVAAVVATRELGTKALHVVAIVCGMLIALACNTVMSIGPLAGIAAFTLALSLAIISRAKKPRVRLVILSLCVSTVVSFCVLFSIVMTTELETVAPPHSSGILRSLPGHHYVDAFQVRISSEVRPNMRSVVEAFLVSLRPWWLKIPEPGEAAHVKIEPGSALGGWEVHEMSPSEIIVGLDRSYIDLRISLFVGRIDEQFTVTATTVARYNNWRGRLYFAPVRFGHQIVLADTMRRLAFILR